MQLSWESHLRTSNQASWFRGPHTSRVGIIPERTSHGHPLRLSWQSWPILLTELAFHKISRWFVCPLKFEKLCFKAFSKVMDPMEECANLLWGALRRAPQSKQQKSRFLALAFPPRSPVSETDNTHHLEASVLIRQGTYSHSSRCQTAGCQTHRGAEVNNATVSFHY